MPKERIDMIEPTKRRKAGRPPLPEEKRLVQRTYSLTLAQHEKIKRNGPDWLRLVIDAAAEVKK